MKVRLRVVVAIVVAVVAGASASNAMAQQQQTVFELATPVPLDQVVSAVETTQARVLEFRHSGISEGGYVLGDDTLPEAIDAYREEYAELHDGAQPQISALTIEGSVPVEALGPLAANATIRRSFVSPTAGQNSHDSPQGAPEEAVAEEESPVGIAATGALFSPTFGTASSVNVSGSRPRRIRQTMTWTSQASIDDFRRRFRPNDAYEHDFKLYNNRNAEFAVHPFCFSDTNNFWATRSGITWDTNFGSAKPYFDTDDSDPCRQQDFTIGLYHPTNLSPNVRYLTTIRTRAGNQSSSRYTLSAQKLVKICDVSPFCVGTIPNTGASQPLIGITRGVAPGCRVWRKGQESRPC